MRDILTASRHSLRSTARRFELVLCCGAAFLLAAPVVQAETVQVSLAQAYAIGVSAFRENNPVLAYRVAKQLLVVRPDDISALMLLAASAPNVGKPREGRIAARKAYLKASKPDQKLHAATYAAVASAKQKRHLLTQLWLRRAYQQAQTDEQRTKIAQNYRQYSRTSPVRLSFSATIAPSSNLNGGADTDLLVIDGIYPVGVLSGAAQALGGIRASVGASLSYTLSESPTHKTSANLAAKVSRVRLSDDAKALAPDISDSDLADTQITGRLTHRIAPQGMPIPDTYSLSLGQSWFGGERYYSFAGVSLSRQFRLGKATGLRLGADYVHQTYQTGEADKGIASLRFGITHRFQNNDRVRLGFTMRTASSDNTNSEFDALSASLLYRLAKPIGPAAVSLGVSYGKTRYDNYAIGFIRVPDGRTDKTTEAHLDLTFKDISYLGFVPQLNVNYSRTRSNVSRFERSATGVGLNFISAF